MDVKTAAMHFIQLASAYVSEAQDMDEVIDQSLEDWTQDFQSYLEVSLRGRRDVDPNHPIFRNEMISLLREMCEDDEGRTRDWRHAMETVLGWDRCGSVVDADGRPWEGPPRFKELMEAEIVHKGRSWECCKPRKISDMTLGMAEPGEFVVKEEEE